MLPGLRVRLSGTTPPSQTEISIVPVDISSRLNMGGAIPMFGVNLDGMTTGNVQYKNIPFDLKRPNTMRAIVVGTQGVEKTGLSQAVTGIPVAEAPTSVVFLHASARRALNRDSVRLIWDQHDTADLLGWYEVVYEDEFVTTIPIRYGVNILEWNWDKRTSYNDYCHSADPVAVGRGGDNQVTFFAYEWVNPRLGKVIKEIRLKGTSGFRGGTNDFNNDLGPVIASNAVMLTALSIVTKRV
jgi:hypothetical protein